jgi:hypothetical protein
LSHGTGQVLSAATGHVVDDDNLVDAFAHQQVGYMRSDQTCPSGDQYARPG